jgi:protein-L-isoaspartate(D-aspartate) O-methyltransferase
MYESERRFFAEEVELAANVRSEALVAAFAAVPREEFLPPGPWQVLTLNPVTGQPSYRTTRDADPRRLLHNVAVALDPARQLNTGHPASLAVWIDALSVAPGDRVVHVGCGTGYYTAILAMLAGEAGSVVAFEVDEQLARDAARNLRPWPQVRVEGDGAARGELPQADAILINAGAAHLLPQWLTALAPGGRLLVPLTFSPVGEAAGAHAAGAGIMIRIDRHGDELAARAISPVAIYPCRGARDEAANRLLGEALRTAGWRSLARLRTDRHEREADCWLHHEEACLSSKSSM